MSGLPVVLWSASGQRFALEAGRVSALRPRSAVPDCNSLDQLIPGLKAEPERFCLGWQTAEGQSGWLAIAEEPLHLQLPLHSLHALPAILQHARQHPSIRALAWHQEQPVLLLDPGLLARASEFRPA